mmetsp:Transcript_12043/g.16841  ORF Transcript_12043/g.16841 Transcript_12043/m.16841 type:complete len:267 (+) Transcript_12043:197-997(+)
MTTAHRPTWKAAVGKAQEGGWSAGGAVSTARSSLDAPAHTKLKYRAEAVDKKTALRESLLKMQEAESKAKQSNKLKLPKRTLHPEIEQAGRLKLLKQTAEVDEKKIRAKYDDGDNEDQDGGDDSDAWSDLDGGNRNNNNHNGDDESDLDASDSDDSSSDSDDDDDDEEALQAELAKIRAEREAVKAKADAKVAAEEESQMEEAALVGNPLLNTAADGAASGKMKRRWNDDVVFRNQAKGEPEIKKRFINDTVRNDFHKRFLNKFIQ